MERETVYWLYTSTVERSLRRGQQQLIKGQIQPAAELEARLPHGAAVLEAESLMKGHAGFVGSVDGADHHVILLRLGALDQPLHQRLPDAAPALTQPYVNRVLDRVLEGRKGAKRAVRCKTEQPTVDID